MAAVSFFAADYVFTPLSAGAGGLDGDFGGLAGETINNDYKNYNDYNGYNFYIFLSDQYGAAFADKLVEILVLAPQLALNYKANKPISMSKIPAETPKIMGALTPACGSCA